MSQETISIQRIKEKATAAEHDEPELKPEFIERMKRIMKQRSIRVKDFARRYEPKKDVRTRYQARGR